MMPSFSPDNLHLGYPRPVHRWCNYSDIEDQDLADIAKPFRTPIGTENENVQRICWNIEDGRYDGWWASEKGERLPFPSRLVKSPASRAGTNPLAGRWDAAICGTPSLNENKQRSIDSPWMRWKGRCNGPGTDQVWQGIERKAATQKCARADGSAKMRETAAGKWRASPAIVVKRLEFPHEGDIFLVIGFGVFLQVLVGHDGRAGAHNRPANRKKQQQQNRTTTTTEEEEEKGRASGGDSIGAASIGAGVGAKRRAEPRCRDDGVAAPIRLHFGFRNSSLTRTRITDGRDENGPCQTGHTAREEADREPESSDGGGGGSCFASLATHFLGGTATLPIAEQAMANAGKEKRPGFGRGGTRAVRDTTIDAGRIHQRQGRGAKWRRISPCRRAPSGNFGCLLVGRTTPTPAATVRVRITTLGTLDAADSTRGPSCATGTRPLARLVAALAHSDTHGLGQIRFFRQRRAAAAALHCPCYACTLGPQLSQPLAAWPTNRPIWLPERHHTPSSARSLNSFQHSAALLI